MASKNPDGALADNEERDAEVVLRTTGMLPTSAATHQRYVAAATADNTRRTYRSAIRHFQAWGGALPANEAVVILYLLAYAETLNPRTLSLRLTALAQWHRYQGFPDPTSTPTVRKTLKGIERTHGQPRQRAKALSMADMERLVAALAGQSELKAVRDNAVLQLGFFGAFRRSEIARLRVADVSWEPDGIVVTLPRSKTDQLGEGVVRGIPYGQSSCCPPSALRRWLDAAGIGSGPLFRAISRWGAVGDEALSAGSINAILIERAKAAGLASAPELSSHSLRRGLATSAYRAGADFRDIKRQGGWRHDGTVQGYIDEAGLFDDNAASVLLRAKP